MKCQYCEKPATFHITELTEPTGPQVMHLCEEHARGFLQKEAASPAHDQKRQHRRGIERHLEEMPEAELRFESVPGPQFGAEHLRHRA